MKKPEMINLSVDDAFNIFDDLIEGIEERHSTPHVTFFGSSRLREDNKYMASAKALAKALSDSKVNVMTGGGPGIMEAANRGAYEGEGVSLAASISLPNEQEENPYIHSSSTHRFFMTRKWMMIENSKAFIAMPGGIGTADEVFEVLTLMQTKMIPQVPVILFGEGFWKPAIEWMKVSMIPLGLINDEDLELVFITDSEEEALSKIGLFSK